MPTLVYRYGAAKRRPIGVTRPDGSPVWERVRVPELVEQQLRLAHELRNTLIEVELAQAGDINAAWSDHPIVGPLEVELSDAGSLLSKLTSEAKRQHVVSRSVATKSSTADEIRSVRQRIKELRARLRALKSNVDDATAELLDSIAARRREAIKATYRIYVQERGLYWATYSAVLDDHRSALRALERRRRQGQPAQMRYRRYSGTGTLTVQLQRRAGQPARSPELLASGVGPWRNVLHLTPWYDPDQHRQSRRSDIGQAQIGVGQGRFAEIPLVMHRMLPASADVCLAQLTVSRTAGQSVMSLAVTVKLPDPPRARRTSSAAVHCGWRETDDGSIRVGVWACSKPLAVPTCLQDVVLAVDGRSGEIVLPAPWVDGFARPQQLQSRRRRAVAAIRDQLADWLDEHQGFTGSGGQPISADDVRRWAAPRRFAALALAWNDHEGDAGDMGSALGSWRAWDRRLWEREAHERAQLVGRRDDAWRRVAAWLADSVGHVVVDDTNFADLRRRADIADDDPVLPGHRQEASRSRSVLAAPGRLRHLIVQAAERRAVAVTWVHAADLSRTCPRCGHVADKHPRFAQARTVTCPVDGFTYDQDRSAAALMLGRATEAGES